MPSTAIEHISYDEAGNELHVKFVGGRTYTYYAVPRSVYEGAARLVVQRHVLQQFYQEPVRLPPHAA